MLGTFGTRVQSFRDRSGLTQEQLGEKADISSRTIQRIERDQHKPSAKTVRRLTVALEIEVSQLSTGLTNDEIAAFQEEFSCPHCGAPLYQRTPIQDEYGEEDVEVFACGFMRG